MSRLGSAGGPVVTPEEGLDPLGEGTPGGGAGRGGSSDHAAAFHIAIPICREGLYDLW